MMVRSSDSDDDEYSPGNQDPYTGQLLMDALEAAVYMASPRSPARDNLQRNFDHWYETVQKMDGTRDWWQNVIETSQNPTEAGLTNLTRNSTFACEKKVESVALPPRACLQLVNAGVSVAESEVRDGLAKSEDCENREDHCLS